MYERRGTRLTHGLQRERKHVPHHKELRQPLLLDQRRRLLLLSLDEQDDPSEFHVDRGGEERRREEDAEGLDDVDASGPVGGLVRVGAACGKADDLDLRGGSQRSALTMMFEI